MYISCLLISILVKEYVHIYNKNIILISFNPLKINYPALSGTSVSMNEWMSKLYFMQAIKRHFILADPTNQHSLLAEGEHFFQSWRYNVSNLQALERVIKH